MTTLALDDNKDFYFINYRLVSTTGLQEIIQRIRVRLQFFKGEWFLNTDHGIPYFQSILGQKAVDLNIVSNIFKNAMLDVDGVLELLEFSIEFDSIRRALIIEFKAKTVEGVANEIIELI